MFLSGYIEAPEWQMADMGSPIYVHMTWDILHSTLYFIYFSKLHYL